MTEKEVLNVLLLGLLSYVGDCLHRLKDDYGIYSRGESKSWLFPSCPCVSCQMLWIMRRRRLLWMVFVLAGTLRATVLRVAFARCEEHRSGLLTDVFTHELSRASRRWLTRWTTFCCWCNFPAPTTTTHSLTLHRRLLLCTFDDSPDEI